MEHDRQNFLSFWTVFRSFTTLWTQKNQNFEKMIKVYEDINILQMCTINDSHMIWGVMDKMFCHIGPFFALLPP